MKKTLYKVLHTGLLITALAAFNGCGQKGPLIVEEPAIDQATTQQEELEQTR